MGHDKLEKLRNNAEVEWRELLKLFQELKNNVSYNYADSDEMNPFNRLIKL